MQITMCRLTLKSDCSIICGVLDLKMSAEDTFKSMGMTMSTAITIFVTQTVRDGQFPFVIKSDPFYSPSNMSVLRRRANDMDAGRNVVEHDLIPDGELVHA